MVFSDTRRIVWHPTKPRRFVIGNVGGGSGNLGGTAVGQIKVYDWDGSSEIAEATTLVDLVHMKCFALSPHPLDTDLIAVGTTSGKVELLRFSIMHPPNTIRSPPVTFLPVRTSRACNALTFSSRDPNYLAVGLDKVRGEPSLVIWDVESTSSKVFNLKMTGVAGKGGDDATTQLQFVSGPMAGSTPTPLPYTRPDPLLPSNTPRNDKYMIQQWLHTETVSSLTFMPHSTDLLVAGVSHRWIRLFDLRSPSGAVGSAGSSGTGPSTSTSGTATAPANPQSIPTKSVYGLCIDPFDHHQFASFGEDGFVRIWDQRYFTTPVLNFSGRDALSDGADPTANNSIAAIEYSKTRRGAIFTLERDAHAVRVWDTVRATIEGQWDYDIKVTGAQSNIQNQGQVQQSPSDSSRKISKLARLPWSTASSSSTATASSTRLSPAVVESYADPVPSSRNKTEYVVLRNTRTSPRSLRTLASFTSIPHPSHWGWGSGADGKSSTYAQTMSMSIAVLTKDGELDIQILHDAPVPQWSARGELSVSAGKGCQVYQPRDEDEAEDIVGSSSNISARGRDKKLGRQGQDNIHSTLAYSHPSRPSSLKRFPLQVPGADIHETPRPGALTLAVEKHLVPGEYRGRSAVAVDTHVTRVHNRGPASGAASRSRRSISKGKLSNGERSSRRAVMDDVSMVMRRRAVRGYAVDNLAFNATIVKSDMFHTDALYELWTWIDSSRTLLSRQSRIHGFNFSNQGIYGIWEGFPADEKVKYHNSERERDEDNERDNEPASVGASSGVHDLNPSPAPAHVYTLAHETGGVGARGHSRSRKSTMSTTTSMYRSHSPSSAYAAAVQVLSGLFFRSEKENVTARDDDMWALNVKIAAPTSKLAQRKLCLLLCGWCLSDEELLAACARWEKEGQLTRAACWLLFINHQDKAIECLMRSDDERLRIMSGTIAALLGQRGTSNQVREHYNRLIVRIEDPYIRVALTHVALEDWTDLLQEESLPLRERLAIALRFLDDRSLSSYLRQLTETFRQRGDIEGVILTGLTPLGFEVVQGYVDTTGDVQTASILASLTVLPTSDAQIRTQRWIEAYRSLLDTWQMFYARCQFDISRGKIIRECLEREWDGGHSQSILHPQPHLSPALGQGHAQVHPQLDWTRPQIVIRCPFCKKNVNSDMRHGFRVGGSGRIRIMACQSCGRSLPRCSICLVVLGLGYDLERDTEIMDNGLQKDTMNDALIFCQTCKHGGHASHMLEWFYGNDTLTPHSECPVPGCDCPCSMK